jgi:putative oxidoreductase
MRARSLLLLRLSLGVLMLIWGVDKLVNVKHGMKVSEHFYLGAFNSEMMLKAFGVLQIALGALLLFGIARRYTYPALLAITGTTLLGVWKSVLDPWGWYLKGGNVLFYLSLIIFAAGLVLWAFRDEDRIVVARASGPAT